MASIPGRGISASWKGQHQAVYKIVSAFIAQDDEVKQHDCWDDLPEDVACAPNFYERLAHFLLHTYVIPEGVRNHGEPLSGDTPKNYLNIALNQAADKFKAVGSDATKRFFSCQDQNSTSAEAVWLRKLRSNMRRDVMARADRDGVEMDKSEGRLPRPPASRLRVALSCPQSVLAVPLYHDAHIRPINTALARKGTVEALTRRIGIQMAWNSAGRAAESSTVCWEGLEWDPQKHAVFAEIKQWKTGKLKIIPFCAGVDRDCCFFLAMGDYLASAKPANWSAGDAWVMPKLAVNTTSPGTTLGDWIRALRPRDRNGAAGYEDVAIAALPSRVSAGPHAPTTRPFAS